LRTKSKDLGLDKNETVYVKIIDKILRSNPNCDKKRITLDKLRPVEHISEAVTTARTSPLLTHKNKTMSRRVKRSEEEELK